MSVIAQALDMSPWSSNTDQSLRTPSFGVLGRNALPLARTASEKLDPKE
jgi:hypothetical protein